MTPVALKISSLSRRYGGVLALREVSFDVRKGEILGLIGANGAGKSTLLNIIGGEERSDTGSILMNGRALVGTPHQRARGGLARTFQHPRVSLDMTIFENVAIGLAVREMATAWDAITLPMKAIFAGRMPSADAVAQVCSQVGLTDLDRPARLLSFGELRLIEVARAVIQKPNVILLDEPFPGLEDAGVAMLLAALRRLSESGETIILVDHNVVIIEALVQRIVLLARGEVVFDGPTQNCVRSKPFLEEYIGTMA